VKTWLLKHPRFHLHFIPTGSSWLNLVERFFAEITVKLLRRGVHRSVTALEKDIRNWIKQWNTNPKPYVWTRTADQILESLAAYCQRINDSGLPRRHHRWRHPPHSLVMGHRCVGSATGLCGGQSSAGRPRCVA
jgi:hypothetical protein